MQDAWHSTGNAQRRDAGCISCTAGGQDRGRAAEKLDELLTRGLLGSQSASPLLSCSTKGIFSFLLHPTGAGCASGSMVFVPLWSLGMDSFKTLETPKPHPGAAFRARALGFKGAINRRGQACDAAVKWLKITFNQPLNSLH